MRVFYDGTLGEPQLDHPEGIAVDRDGSVWCGGEREQIFRIAPDGSALEQVASTGGFCLGLAFGPDDALYVCDLKHQSVFRLAAGCDRPERFADGLRIPNSPCFDADGRIYVSDSHGFKEPGPGIRRFEPDGSGGCGTTSRPTSRTGSRWALTAGRSTSSRPSATGSLASGSRTAQGRRS
jgi:gluconolactonase